MRGGRVSRGLLGLALLAIAGWSVLHLRAERRPRLVVVNECTTDVVRAARLVRRDGGVIDLLTAPLGAGDRRAIDLDVDPSVYSVTLEITGPTRTNLATLEILNVALVAGETTEVGTGRLH